MVDNNDMALLKRLLVATPEREIRWREVKDVDVWYKADVGGHFPASFRFLRYEAANQIGADPMAIQLQMPARNAVYFAGTPGFQVFLEILSLAFEHWRPAPDAAEALQLLEEGLARRRAIPNQPPD